MKLDATYLKYITRDELRVLTAIEMGMRNHEFVPTNLIEKISQLKRANAYSILRELQKNKLIVYENKKVTQCYKLTYMGYDYLALYVFIKRGHIKEVIGKVGVGKESDIYKCIGADDEVCILKFARLGRISFRTIKNNRDYLRDRQNFNWLYLSRIASVKEYSFMEILYSNGFPTPRPIDSNRHGILMSLIDGNSLFQVRDITEKTLLENLYQSSLDLIVRFAQHGLIHSDFNEHNLMMDNHDRLRVIDFPQMVSVQNKEAEFYYNRDVECVFRYFRKKHDYENLEIQNQFPQLKDIKVEKNLDTEMKASGFIKTALKKGFNELSILDRYNQMLDQLDENEKVELDENEGQYSDDENNDSQEDGDYSDFEEEFKDKTTEDQQELGELEKQLSNITAIDKQINEEEQKIDDDFNQNSSEEEEDDEEDEEEEEEKVFLSKEDYKKKKEEEKRLKAEKKLEQKKALKSTEEYIKKAIDKKNKIVRTYKTNKNHTKHKQKVPEAY